MTILRLIINNKFLKYFRNCTGSDEGISHFVHGRHVKVKPSFSSSYEANTASNKVTDSI